MKWQNAIDEILEKANPSIVYRMYRDILGGLDPADAAGLCNAVRSDPAVKFAFSLQKQDGYFGDVFHSGFDPKGKYKGKYGVEGITRFLYEKGVESADPRIKAGLNALDRENWLGQDKGIWCVYYKEMGLYGPDLIKACLLAMFGAISEDELAPLVADAVKTFEDMKSFDSYDSITEDFKYGGKVYSVYKKGIRFPEYYHLKLLAFTGLWRRGDGRRIVVDGVKKLMDLSPLREVRVKYRSRWLAPGGIRPFDLKIKLADLAREGWEDSWTRWFVTFEHFARMGIVRDVPELAGQANQLMELLDAGNGFFPIDLKIDYFNRWGPFMGLALENDWKEGRGKYDLTFRSLLILKLAGMVP